MVFILTKLIRYPSKPSPGKLKPDSTPRKAPNGDPLFISNVDSDDEGDSTEEALIGGEADPYSKQDVHIPGCRDRHPTENPTDDSADESEDESEDDLPKLPTRVIPS